MILRRQPEDNTHERQTDSGVLRLRQLPVSQSRVTTLLPSSLNFRERMAPELLIYLQPTVSSTLYTPNSNKTYLPHMQGPYRRGRLRLRCAVGGKRSG